MSSTSGKDLEMDPVAVRNITNGLRAAIGELREFGAAGPASMGGGFKGLAMTGMEAGHPQVTDVFQELCTRWEWGVRGLVLSASSLASDLGISAGMVWEEDQYREGTFKVAVNSVVGNPHADEDETERKSWDEIKTPFRQETPEEAQKARDDFQQSWNQAKQDAMTKGFTGQVVERVAEHTGVDREALDQARNRAIDGDR
ncbi:hypothetical protein [Streptomyces sp. NBC_01408]|uniref:hypothetical protein n=1 Tax=Streptomyces sp. NBC_01408 TaxID=2903855 RepID=UPI002257C389|nr:hypothetical protein [Streptomyces sp. NBC_01408]MCX4692682.1 hypothetical protein [Streptomyces sp. NBC_01408]